MSGYRQFSLYERNKIEEGLHERLSLRKISEQLGRQASSVSREIKANRNPFRGKGKLAECPMAAQCKVCAMCAACEHDNRLCKHCPEYDCRTQCESYIKQAACPKLAVAPWVCNPCTKYRFGCNRTLRLEYKAAVADKTASERRSDARKGVDMQAGEFEHAIDVIRPAIARGLSPYEIATAYAKTLKVSASTIYRWVERGYGGMANIELERKVGFKPRAAHRPRRCTRHGQERSYEAFLALPQDERDSAAEMDTVEGRKADTACILTLYSRPSHFQLYSLLGAQTEEEVHKALDELEQVMGLALFKSLFWTVLTDNGHEFENPEALEASVTRTGEKRCRVFYCDPRQSQQKGGCEKNHTELRQVLPKRSVRFDCLTRRDISLVCSHVNSNPRKSLCGMSPVKMLAAAFGKAVEDALCTLGINEIAPDDLNLKPALLNDARAWRGENLLDFNPQPSK